MRWGLSILCTCKGHARVEADSCSRNSRQSPNCTRYIAGRQEADGHLQDAASPECSCCWLCCDLSTGSLARRWRSSTAHAPPSVLCVCVCMCVFTHWLSACSRRGTSWKEAWDVRSSGMLRSADWQFVTAVSAIPVGLIFSVKQSKTPEGGTDRFSRNVLRNF